MGDGNSGQITVSRLARYIQIYATNGATVYVDESSITVSVSANAWTTTARLVAGGITLDGSFTIATGGSSCSLTVTGASADGILNAATTLYFNMAASNCSFTFDRIQGTLTFPFGCLETVTAAWKVSCVGFDELSFATTDLDIGWSCITFDARVAFSTISKTVSLTPKLNLGNDACFTVYASLVAGDGGVTEIAGVSIYGLLISYNWDGVSFESLSYFDGLHRVKDTYWERFTIKSTGDSCCGGNLTFEVSTYFQDAHATLFDWAETDMEISIGLASNTTVSTSIVVDTTGIINWIIGFRVTW